MKVLLLGNYAPDHQYSMDRFCSLLENALKSKGHQVLVTRPKRLLGGAPGALMWRWLGYLDKYILFPFFLQRSRGWPDVIHILDQSNALYLPFLKYAPALVTCHDILAIRASLGEQTYCAVSATGRLLQARILASLKQCTVIACDSTATQLDVTRLIPSAKTHMIPLAVSSAFRRLDETEILSHLAKIHGLDQNNPFLLHVGSSQPRKNREGVIRVFARISHHFSGQLVFAGDALSEPQIMLARELGIYDRVVEAGQGSDEMLAALYNQAFAFLFPSFSEGFGWPLLEAQACGCPVVSSNACSLAEVAGNSAILHDPDDEDGFVVSLSTLKDQTRRQEIIALGFLNADKYTSMAMVERYENLYKEVVGQKGTAKLSGAAKLTKV